MLDVRHIQAAQQLTIHRDVRHGAIPCLRADCSTTRLGQVPSDLDQGMTVADQADGLAWVPRDQSTSRVKHANIRMPGLFRPLWWGRQRGCNRCVHFYSLESRCQSLIGAAQTRLLIENSLYAELGQARFHTNGQPEFGCQFVGGLQATVVGRAVHSWCPRKRCQGAHGGPGTLCCLAAFLGERRVINPAIVTVVRPVCALTVANDEHLCRPRQNFRRGCSLRTCMRLCWRIDGSVCLCVLGFCGGSRCGSSRGRGRGDCSCCECLRGWVQLDVGVNLCGIGEALNDQVNVLS
mmetsp:Transcript_75455/g.245439  ORF Transcript_75455/g.245439 Transcript_75455/m.245439 type:complete len:293 (-) Transcript_75455:570-1448(-)